MGLCNGWVFGVVAKRSSVRASIFCTCRCSGRKLAIMFNTLVGVDLSAPVAMIAACLCIDASLADVVGGLYFVPCCKHLCGVRNMSAVYRNLVVQCRCIVYGCT